MKKNNMKCSLMPTYLYSEAERRLFELQSVMEAKKQLLDQAPKGKIRISIDKRRVMFYLRTLPTDKSGTYLKKTETTKIKTYLQKSYDTKIVKLLNKEIATLTGFLEKSYFYATDSNQITSETTHNQTQFETNLKKENQTALTNQKSQSQSAQTFNRAQQFLTFPHLIRNVYSDYPNEIKQYITPVDLDDDDFATRWLAEPYEGKSIMDNVPFFETTNHERVRSKSELNIANMLAKFKIPYKYECPLRLRDGTIIYPDFTVLDTKHRKVIYWEHRGMMDDREYAKHSVARIKNYMGSGIMLGDNLIITEETASSPLGTNEIKAVITMWFVQ